MRALYFFNSPTSLNNGPSIARADNDSGGPLFSEGGLLKKYKTQIKSLYYYYYYNTYLQIVFEGLKYNK